MAVAPPGADGLDQIDEPLSLAPIATGPLPGEIDFGTKQNIGKHYALIAIDK